MMQPFPTRFDITEARIPYHLNARQEHMYTIKVTTPFPRWPLTRQTPGSSGHWGNCRFVVDQPLDKCDAWFVLEDLCSEEQTWCPQGNTLFVAFEHSEVRHYSARFLGQFQRVLTCNDKIHHPGLIRSQLGFGWHVGVDRVSDRATVGFDELTQMKDISKSALLSTVCSDKAMTRAHRQRLIFTETLKDHFGSNIAIFGRGLNEIADKWDAIHPYRYHIVIENGSYDDWWTEKLADAFLGFSFPFYWGCPNAESYFPKGSFTRIDIYKPAEAIQTIEMAISQDIDRVMSSQILEARARVLNHYNIFAVLSDVFEQMRRCNADGHQLTRLRPSAAYQRRSALTKLSCASSRLLSALRRGLWFR